ACRGVYARLGANAPTPWLASENIQTSRADVADAGPAGPKRVPTRWVYARRAGDARIPAATSYERMTLNPSSRGWLSMPGHRHAAGRSRVQNPDPAESFQGGKRVEISGACYWNRLPVRSDRLRDGPA